MFGKKQPEVLVVGAGPVGMVAALALKRAGIAVEVIDKEWRTGTRSYALALHAGSLRLLEELGLLKDVLEQAYRVRTVGLYDGAERRAEMRISELAEDYSFVAVMRQDHLEHLLEAALQRAGVKIEWSHELASLHPEGESVNVKIDKLAKDSLGYIIPHTEWIVTKSREGRYPFVVGTDGHRSRVRRSLGVGFPEVGDAQDFSVFEFETRADFGHDMRVGITDGKLNVCWPLPDGYCRFGFEMPPYDQLDESREKERGFGAFGPGMARTLTEGDLQRLITERAPWFDGDVGAIRWRMVVRFERRLAESFGQGRVWLAGDAAHMTGPAGVQSMNVGLREAIDLAEALTRVLRGGAPVDELESYGRSHRTEWQQLLGLQGGVTTTPECDPWVAANKDRLLPCVPASGADLAALLAQIGLSL